MIDFAAKFAICMVGVVGLRYLWTVLLEWMIG